MATSQSSERVAAENWFLRRGLASVLTPRARWRRLLRRSAPALAAFATLMAASLILGLATHYHGVIVIGEGSSPRAWLAAAALVLVLPSALLAGWLVTRVESARGRRIAAWASIAVALICDVFNGPTSDLITDLLGTVVFVALVLLLNGLGIGAVLGWAVRLSGARVTSLGGLFARALPVVLLTVLVFFNGYVWSMATRISRDRIWLVISFLVLIAVAFLITGIVDRVQPMLKSTKVRETDEAQLADTPFAMMADPATAAPLSPGERANVIFVVLMSQVAQIAMVALVTAAIFFTLGVLALSPELQDEWTQHSGELGTLMGFTLPVPQALIHVAMFLGALTFMYVSARAVGDGEYREEFLDPLIDDLRFTLVARNRYLAHIGRIQ